MLEAPGGNIELNCHSKHYWVRWPEIGKSEKPRVQPQVFGEKWRLYGSKPFDIQQNASTPSSALDERIEQSKSSFSKVCLKNTGQRASDRLSSHGSPNVARGGK